MDNHTQQLHNRVNHAIIKCRGLYSQWAKRRGGNYNRMPFAGAPPTIQLSGTSFVTTAPAATTTLLPMVTTGQMFLRLGLATVIGENGSTLSGGECQRPCASEGRIREPAERNDRCGRLEAARIEEKRVILPKGTVLNEPHPLKFFFTNLRIIIVIVQNW